MPLWNTDSLILTEDDFLRVSDVIYNHCGINLHDGKHSLVRARLAKRIRSTNFDNFKDYIDYVLSDAGRQEFIAFVDSLSTNLTSFFREKVHFDYLQETFLPQLVQEKEKKGQHRIRGWSAGCSSGEEPYSMAITLLESIPQNWDCKILASDVSTRILQMAQAGTYDEERVAPLTPAQKSKYLVPNRIEGHKVYQVHSQLQKIIHFRYLNLMEPWPFKGPFDFIFCRNVMIYFDKATQQKLVNRFWEVLAPGGLLCIGHSESLTSIQHSFQYVIPATYRKRV